MQDAHGRRSKMHNPEPIKRFAPAPELGYQTGRPTTVGAAEPRRTTAGTTPTRRAATPDSNAPSSCDADEEGVDRRAAPEPSAGRQQPDERGSDDDAHVIGHSAQRKEREGAAKVSRTTPFRRRRRQRRRSERRNADLNGDSTETAGSVQRGGEGLLRWIIEELGVVDGEGGCAAPRHSERAKRVEVRARPRCRSLDSALRAPLGMTKGERCALRSG